MKYYIPTTEYNRGIDLQARQMYVCVMDRQGRILVHTLLLHLNHSKQVVGGGIAVNLRLNAPNVALPDCPELHVRRYWRIAVGQDYPIATWDALKHVGRRYACANLNARAVSEFLCDDATAVEYDCVQRYWFCHWWPGAQSEGEAWKLERRRSPNKDGIGARVP